MDQTEELNEIIDVCDVDPWQGINTHAWRTGLFASLSLAQIRRRLSEAVFRAQQGRFVQTDCDVQVRILMENCLNPRLEYLAVANLLRKYGPKSVVVNSNIGIPLMVRAWTRRNGVGHVQLPHGVTYNATLRSYWDADVVGVLGDDLAGKLRELHLDKFDSVRVVGGAHIAAQARRAHVEAPSFTQAAQPWKACFLLSGPIAFGLPDTFAEIERDVLALARCVEKHGGRLRLRCHRGSPNATMYRLIAERGRDEGLVIESSDPLSSLGQEFANASLALIRVWGGAGVIALYDRIPLVGWVPRGNQDESSVILNNLPLHAETPEQFDTLLSELLGSEAMRQDALGRQRQFLERHISRPDDPPYERSAETVIQFCERYATQNR